VEGCVKNILGGYNLTYYDLFCIITDTEATMAKATRKLHT